VRGCNYCAETSLVSEHLILQHQYQHCLQCGGIMHKKSLSAHRKICPKKSRADNTVVYKQPDWTREDAEAYVTALNDQGGDLWSIRSSYVGDKFRKHCYWRCFWSQCTGRCQWTEKGGFQHLKCSNHPSVPGRLERIPSWLVADWQRKAQEGVCCCIL